jgi:hypothetical protein
MHLLSDTALLHICGVKRDDASITSEWLADLQLVVPLVGSSYPRPACALECGMALLASLLGQLAQHNPVHLPFGYEGPTVRSHEWLDRHALEHVGQQVVGLAWNQSDPEAVSNAVEEAVSRALRFGFVQHKEYDAWRPGMASGSGWRSAVRATLYGLTRARSLAGATANRQSPAPAIKVANQRPKPGRGAEQSPPLDAAPTAAEEPTTQTARFASGPAVKLGRRGEPCYVFGKEKPRLTDAQYSVIQALQEAGEEGLTKDALEAVRSSARRILKNLSHDEDWADVILMPGQTNGRYRLRS